MIKITIECEKCRSESEIREENLMFPEEKKMKRTIVLNAKMKFTQAKLMVGFT